MIMKIKDFSNGATLYHKDEEGLRETIYEFTEDNMERLAALLYDIKEGLSIFDGDNYAKEKEVVFIGRLKIHGRKYECNEKDCKLCKCLKLMYEVFDNEPGR